MNTPENNEARRVKRSSSVIEYLQDLNAYTESEDLSEPAHELAKKAVSDFILQAEIDKERGAKVAQLTSVQVTAEILDAYIDGVPEESLADLFAQAKRLYPRHGVDVWAQDQLRRYIKLRKKNQRPDTGESFEWNPGMALDLDEVLESVLATEEKTRAYAGQLRLLFGKAQLPQGVPRQVVFTALQQSSSRLRTAVHKIDKQSNEVPVFVKKGSEIILDVVGHSARELVPLRDVILKRAMTNALPLDEERLRTESLIAQTISFIYAPISSQAENSSQ